MADKAEESWMNEPLDPAEQKAQGARTGTGKKQTITKGRTQAFSHPHDHLLLLNKMRTID